MMIDFKYAAGFVDADGSIQIHAKKFDSKFAIYPVVSVTQLPHRSNFLQDVSEFFELSVHRNHRGTDEVRVSGKKGTRFLEHIKNHLVLKQELAEYILNLPQFVNETELKAIKKVIKNLRRNNTPCKHRPSRRWAAGYIDGDGCISASVTSRGSLECRLSVTSWVHAQAGLVLLKETFGGYIVEHKNTANWRVSLSPSKVQEIKEFLGKHLMIKKTQLELAYDFIGKNKHSRRMGATDEDLRNFCKTLATTKSESIRKDDVIV
jgi:hypothetical protein